MHVKKSAEPIVNKVPHSSYIFNCVIKNWLLVYLNVNDIR